MRSLIVIGEAPARRSYSKVPLDAASGSNLALYMADDTSVDRFAHERYERLAPYARQSGPHFRMNLLDCCRTINLLPYKADWTAADRSMARAQADNLRSVLMDEDVLLLGAKVRDAFGLKGRVSDLTIHGPTGRFAWRRALVCAHPSGQSREWSDPSYVARFREALAVLQPPAVMETNEGKYVDLRDFRPEVFSKEVVARVLARAPRYTGHTLGDVPLSVAQHCVLTAWIRVAHAGLCFADKREYVQQCMSDEEWRLATTCALLHDLDEAVTMDLNRALCRLLGGRFARLKPRLRRALLPVVAPTIAKVIGDQDPDAWPGVKNADVIALGTEARAWMPRADPSRWAGVPEIPPEQLGCPLVQWPADVAERAWLAVLTVVDGGSTLWGGNVWTSIRGIIAAANNAAGYKLPKPLPREYYGL